MQANYDISKAQGLKTLALIDFNGKPVADKPWHDKYKAFKILVLGDRFFRFFYSLERTAYYTEAGVLDFNSETPYRPSVVEPVVGERVVTITTEIPSDSAWQPEEDKLQTFMQFDDVDHLKKYIKAGEY